MSRNRKIGVAYKVEFKAIEISRGLDPARSDTIEGIIIASKLSAYSICLIKFEVCMARNELYGTPTKENYQLH